MARWKGFVAAVVGFLPGLAVAQEVCSGTDLIATMAEEDRAKIVQAADNLVYGEGLLWRATKGDITIDLFGTYHFKHAQTQAHLDRLKPLIEAASKIYLEISNDDQAQMQRDLAADPSMMFITEGPTLPDLLGEDDWQDFSDEMTARNIPAFMAAKFKPLWASMMLGIGPCEARSGALESAGIDTLVGEYAAELGNPSRSLEDFGVLLNMLDGFPIDDQLDMIRMTLAWPGNTDDLSYTIRERYLDEEIALTWEFSRFVTLKYGGDNGEEGFDLIEELLLERRNKDWIDVLRTEVAPGDRVFIAVGAGHFPGEIGVLRLLENEGYTIERVPL